MIVSRHRRALPEIATTSMLPAPHVWAMTHRLLTPAVVGNINGRLDLPLMELNCWRGRNHLVLDLHLLGLHCPHLLEMAVRQEMHSAPLYGDVFAESAKGLTAVRLG